ncbi:TonB-dependent receptor [Fodinibius salsisoli]|uniref:TonB-dependent receptor n=1 Tax=Fodinibius salsisoli TaxID=2820877 RepID=A0ABT3PNY0_9BACT|nr:carboxypeptidase-like regulatory domain-containing protein [Fodinibius salsisoli]MCW9707564.1 TonB-dependent receptor [Fodinibius salsisoli]
MMLCWIPSLAQDQQTEQFSFDFRGQSLSSVLQTIADKTATDMVYDPGIIEGVSVYTRIEDENVPEILRGVLQATSLDFITLSSGTVVIVKKVTDDPSYGSYSGKIVDLSTGEPLPGASVRVTNAPGGTSTGRGGRFALDNLISGSYNIVFSYVGYEPVYKTIDITPNENLREQVELKPEPVDFMPIVVTGHIPQVPMSSEGASIGHRKWRAGSRIPDALRSLSLFSGVQHGLSMADVHLQGGQQGEHRIQLDGVPVYNPFSFGKMFSAFSPYAINKVQIHKAGYDVSEGSQIAGLINLDHELSSMDDHQFLIQADPLSVNIRAEIQVLNKKDSDPALSIMAAARSNYWGVYQEPTLKGTLQQWNELDPLTTNQLVDIEQDASRYEPYKHKSKVRFYDLHLASAYDIDDYQTFSASFYLGENNVTTGLLRQAPPSDDAPRYLKAGDAYYWNNFMGQISYNHLISSRIDLETQVSFTSNRFQHNYSLNGSNDAIVPGFNNLSSESLADAPAFGEYPVDYNLLPNQRNSNRIQHLIARTDATYSFSPQFDLEVGLQADHIRSRINFTDLFYLPTLADQESVLLGNYIKGNWKRGKYWKLSLGNRLTYASAFGRIYAEPRGSIQFDQPDAGIGYWSVRFSGGLYHQFVNQFEVTNPGPTSLVPSFSIWSHEGLSKAPKAWHIGGSFNFQPADETTIKLEGFYKWQPTTYTVSYQNLLREEDINRSTLNAFAETTEMENIGAAIRFHQAVSNARLKFMLGYDFNYNRINLDTQFGRALPASWNEPHRLQVRSLWRFLSDWTAVAKWQTVWGRAWGFRQTYYNYLFFEGGGRFGDFVFTHPEDDRLAPFHQLDLSLSYQPSFDLVDMELRLDLINVLDRRNTIDWSLRPKEESNNEYKIQKRTMPGFHPSLSIQMKF